MKRAGLLAIVVAMTSIVPIVVLLVRAGAASVGWVSTWLGEDAVRATEGTLLTSTAAALFAFLVGGSMALFVARTDLFGTAWLRRAFTLPSALPPFILGMGWVSLANPRAGLLNLLLGRGAFDVYGVTGISLVLGTAALPLVFLPTVAALERIDSALEEAARLSGASPLRALWSVSMPLGLPAALSGAALAFLFSASAFGVPYLLGVTATPPTPTLTTRIYSEVLMGGSGLGRAGVLSVELLALAGVVLWLSRRLARSGRVALSLGKGGSRRALPLGALRVPLSLAAALTAIILVLLPLAAVALTSVQPTWGELSGLTFRHWGSVLSNPRTTQAFALSTQLSFGAALLVTGVGLAIAWTRRSWLEALGGAPYAIPGTVLALALVVTASRDVRLVAFDRIAFVLALSNTAWLLLMAYAVKHLAFGVRNSADGLAQLDGSLPEAARVFGASPGRAFFDATLPQLKGPLVAAFLVTFLTCMTELTLSVLLIPTGRDVLGTLLFDLQSYADPGSAAVLATAFVALVLAVQSALAFFRKDVR